MHLKFFVLASIFVGKVQVTSTSKNPLKKLEPEKQEALEDLRKKLKGLVYVLPQGQGPSIEVKMQALELINADNVKNKK